MKLEEKKGYLLICFLLFITAIFFWVDEGNMLSKKDFKTKEIVAQEMEKVKIDINNADIYELTKIPGVGYVTSKRIVDFREKNGPFLEVDQITRIKGIGPKKFLKIKPYVSLE